MYSVYRRIGVISNPPRLADFTVAAQTPPGYAHYYGPTSFAQCAAEMRRLRVPGWGS